MDSKEIQNEAFQQWWDSEASDGQWTRLERMAAYDAWFAALSTIDPDAIRRECADRAIAWYRKGQLIPAHKESFAIKQLRAAILGREPAQDDGTPEVSPGEEW